MGDMGGYGSHPIPLANALFHGYEMTTIHYEMSLNVRSGDIVAHYLMYFLWDDEI